MAALGGPRLCRLEIALGRGERCPEGACPFLGGDTPVGGHCAIEELDLAGRPDLAGLLVRIRGQLETAETRAEEDEARLELYRLLETGDADGG